jgi:hypothetical protein
MGAKESKPSTIPNKFDFPVVTESDFSFNVAKLTSADEEKDPNQVLVLSLIALYLDVHDVGRLAQVSKRCHRASLSPIVWFRFAQELGLSLENRGATRRSAHLCSAK